MVRRRSLILAALFCARAASGQTPLDRFVGRDFWKEKPSSEERAVLQRLVGAVPKGFIMEPVPWHVWKTGTGGQTRYVLLLLESEISVPGGSSAAVELFDASGIRIKSWSFQTGWRGSPDSASFEHRSEVGSDLIVLNMSRFTNGRDIAKEYFALKDDALKLVRLENAGGEAVQNEYVFTNFEIGIPPAATLIDDWAKMLNSEDLTEILSALVFLGGRHITESTRHFASQPNESSKAELFRQLIFSPQVHMAIERLKTSENEWIRQAAALAARAPGGAAAILSFACSCESNSFLSSFLGGLRRLASRSSSRVTYAPRQISARPLPMPVSSALVGL